MKTLVFLSAMCVACSAGAMGQTVGYVMSSQPVILTMPEHPQHASQTPLAPEQSLLESSEPVWGHGERPLWEFMPEPPFVCLGDVARSLRQEHAAVKKANKVWRNY